MIDGRSRIKLVSKRPEVLKSDATKQFGYREMKGEQLEIHLHKLFVLLGCSTSVELLIFIAFGPGSWAFSLAATVLTTLVYRLMKRLPKASTET
jgi:hypothetical protein